MAAPEAGTPFSEIEVPERMVDASRLPIEDPGELAVDGQQLILVDVAVHENVPMARRGSEHLTPPADAVTPVETLGRLGDGGDRGRRIESPAQPVHVGAIVMGTRREVSARSGWCVWCATRTPGAPESEPRGLSRPTDGAAQSHDGCERQRDTALVRTHLPDQMWNHREARRPSETDIERSWLRSDQSTLIGCRGKEEGVRSIENDVPGPAGEVDLEVRIADTGQ